MTSKPNHEPASLRTGSRERERYWARKLGRLRLGAEPLAQQVERYRRVTVVLSLVPLGIGLMILAIFTAFGRPDVGALIAAVLVIPIVTAAWYDFTRLKRNAEAYERERQSMLEDDASASKGP